MVLHALGRMWVMPPAPWLAGLLTAFRASLASCNAQDCATLLWALAMRDLSPSDRDALVEVAAVARGGGPEATAAVAEARRLYDTAGVVASAAAVATEELPPAPDQPAAE
jgi:hypothetical protein